MKLSNLKTKKAISFFLFDAVIASVVFFVALTIINVSMGTKTNVESPKIFAESTMNYFVSTQVQDIDSEYIRELMVNKTIEPDSTIFNQILLFYHEGINATHFINDIIKSSIPTYLGITLNVSGKSDSRIIFKKESLIKEQKLVAKIKRIGFAKDKDDNIYGPYILTISLWY